MASPGLVTKYSRRSPKLTMIWPGELRAEAHDLTAAAADLVAAAPFPEQLRRRRRGLETAPLPDSSGCDGRWRSMRPMIIMQLLVFLGLSLSPSGHCAQCHE